MALAPGTRLGPYEILSALGAGGMGEVYRARDTKLDREVAIKVLPELFVADPERVARFQREAKTLAALNHPHIGGIYGLEDADGVRALVLELVEGPTLADRIAQGPIPLDEALPIARQIAEALEAAHEQGIIHRDLKPANIKVRDDGTVKILDFGLAKALEPKQPSGVNVTQSPTITTPAMMTGVGVILGTAAYMSPEQALAKPVNAGADIWAFGCVVYEMLSGVRAFQRGEASLTLVAVLRDEPDWTRLPRATPESIRRMLRRCLTKDPRARLRAIADAQMELDEPADAMPARPAARRPRLAVGALLVALSTASGFALATFTAPPAPAPAEMRVDIDTLPTDAAASFALSPDGRSLVFTGAADGAPRLWLRSLDSGAVKPLRGTEGGLYPFWSPNNRSIGFFADAKVKRTTVDSGVVQVVADAVVSRGGAWSRDDDIVFEPRGAAPLVRVAATGGTPTSVTRLQPRQGQHVFPQFLPDGRHFLFFVAGPPDTSGVFVGALDGGDARRLMEADAAAVFAPPGQLLFVRQGTLFAQRFDPVRLTMSGDPTVLAGQIAAASTDSVSALSTSSTGMVAYRTGPILQGRQFVWLDRAGQEVAKVGDADVSRRFNPELSPDGRRVVMDRTVSGNTDIWVMDLDRGISTRLTSDATVENYPIWSPDGRHVVFQSNRNGVFDLYQKSADESGDAELLLGSPLSKTAMDWSSDGRFILFGVNDPKTGNDLWALPTTGDRKPFPVVQSKFEERNGQFSPDGKWIAYHSNESGRYEIYVRHFSGPGASLVVSSSGGAQARWRPDGKELFYIALDGRLMAVPMKMTVGRIEPGAPVPLFPTHIGGAIQSLYKQQYSVSPDGRRFLMSNLTESSSSFPITLLLNWQSALEARERR